MKKVLWVAVVVDGEVNQDRDMQLQKCRSLRRSICNFHSVNKNIGSASRSSRNRRMELLSGEAGAFARYRGLLDARATQKKGAHTTRYSIGRRIGILRFLSFFLRLQLDPLQCEMLL